MAGDNVRLGQFTLDGIPPAPRGIPQIEVTFNIDVNGILNVSAKDKGTGKNQKITIQSSNLSKEDIERMKNDAEANADEDNKKREAAEARNEADSAVFAAEKLMSELGDKMTADEKGKVNSRIEDLKKALDSGDIANMKSAKAELDKTLQEFSTRLYQQAAPEQGAGSGATGASSGDFSGYDDTSPGGSAQDGDTVDAEFTDQGAKS